MEVHDEVELRCLFDGEISGLGAMQYAINVPCGPTEAIRNVGTVSCEATIGRILTLRIDGRNSSGRGQLDDGDAMIPEHRAGQHDETIAAGQGTSVECL